MSYRPPYTHTPAIVRRVAAIGEARGARREALGRLSAQWERGGDSRLRRRGNRIRSVHGSLAIEGNTLSEAQITAILDGRRVIATPREIQECLHSHRQSDAALLGPARGKGLRFYFLPYMDSSQIASDE